MSGHLALEFTHCLSLTSVFHKPARGIGRGGCVVPRRVRMRQVLGWLTKCRGGYAVPGTSAASSGRSCRRPATCFLLPPTSLFPSQFAVSPVSPLKQNRGYMEEYRQTYRASLGKSSFRAHGPVGLSLMSTGC